MEVGRPGLPLRKEYVRQRQLGQIRQTYCEGQRDGRRAGGWYQSMGWMSVLSRGVRKVEIPADSADCFLSPGWEAPGPQV